MTENVLSLVPDTTVFLSLSGSRLYGINTETSDYDYIGAFVQPIEDLIYHQKISHQDIKAPDDDIEGVLYSFSRFIKLLSAGNPTLIAILFSDPLIDTFNLLSIRDRFITKQVLCNFFGYAKDQLKRIKTDPKVQNTRTHLVQQHGYDTKYAAHVIRLCYQGIELGKTGTLILPKTSDDLTIKRTMDVREGAYDYSAFSHFAETLLKTLDDIIIQTNFPKKSDQDFLALWLTKKYLQYYELIREDLYN